MTAYETAFFVIAIAIALVGTGMGILLYLLSSLF